MFPIPISLSPEAGLKKLILNSTVNAECEGWVNKEHAAKPAQTSPNVEIIPPWKNPWCCKAASVLGISMVTEPFYIFVSLAPKRTNNFCLWNKDYTIYFPTKWVTFIHNFHNIKLMIFLVYYFSLVIFKLSNKFIIIK
jgi:hypothetical protein